MGNTPRVLILTPTRELATQITEAVGKYGKFLRCNIVSLVGGMPYRQQLRGLARAIDIIVATPGRLMDHMSSGRLDLSDIEMLILDEADRMLDMGFIDDVKSIASVMPKNRQTLLFSATVDDRLTQIIRQFLNDPVRVEIETEKLAPTKITQELYLADSPQHKMQLFLHCVKELNIFKAIIFSATKINADRLADDLEEQGFAAAALHGDLKQSVRTRTLDKLRRGKIQFLVATDVAARGIDIQDITHVINFDLPKFSEDYVHRIGRTGRAGRDGIAISLALPSDARHIQRIERMLRQTLERKTIAGLEPKKQFSTNNATNKKPKHKKKYGSDNAGQRRDNRDGRDSRNKKPFARDNAAPRKFKKELSSRDNDFQRKPKKKFEDDRNDGTAFRKPKKRFESDRNDSAAFRKPKKKFEGDRNDSAAFRKPKKKFESDRNDSAAFRKPKNKFESDRNASIDFRKPKKKFESDRNDSTASRKPKKKFENNDRNDFTTKKPKKTFAKKRDDFSPQRPQKEWKSRDKNTTQARSAKKPAKRFSRDYL